MRAAPAIEDKLKVQLKRELDLALWYHRVGNNASGPRPIVNEVVRLSEDSVVEGIKEFCAKLESNLLGESEELASRQVSTLLPGPSQNVLARVAETSGRTVRNREVVYVEPQVGAGI